MPRSCFIQYIDIIAFLGERFRKLIQMPQAAANSTAESGPGMSSATHFLLLYKRRNGKTRALGLQT